MKELEKKKDEIEKNILDESEIMTHAEQLEINTCIEYFRKEAMKLKRIGDKEQAKIGLETGELPRMDFHIKREYTELIDDLTDSVLQSLDRIIAQSYKLDSFEHERIKHLNYIEYPVK